MAVRAGLTPFEASNTASMYTSPYPEIPSALPQYQAKVDSLIGSGAFQQQAPTEQQDVEQPAKVYVNTGTNQYFVNGLMFDIDDHTQAVESERYLSLPEMRIPEGDGWQEVDRNSFQGFIDKIKNPSTGTIFKKNVGVGVDILQHLGGNALQLVGDTTGVDWLSDIGEGISDQQEIDLDKKAIYQSQFTDIENSGDAVNWFVGVLGQQTPIIAEVIASFAAGYALGGFNPYTGGPLGLAAAGTTLLKSLGTKKLVTPFIRKGLKKEFDEAFKAAIKAQKNNKKFSTLSKLHQKRIRQATGITAVFANNYAFGMGDLYGELKGADPENAIWKSWVAAYPYAIAETMPEMLLAGRLLGGIRGKGGILKRLGTGLTVGGIAEGSVEAFQETLLLSSNPEVDLLSPEGINRLTNSFAAGFAIGAPIGGGANVLMGKRDLINRGEQGQPTTPTEPTNVDNVKKVEARIKWLEVELAKLTEMKDKKGAKGRQFRIVRLNKELDSLYKERAAVIGGIDLSDEDIKELVQAQVLLEKTQSVYNTERTARDELVDIEAAEAEAAATEEALAKGETSQEAIDAAAAAAIAADAKAQVDEIARDKSEVARKTAQKKKEVAADVEAAGTPEELEAKLVEARRQLTPKEEKAAAAKDRKLDEDIDTAAATEAQAQAAIPEKETKAQKTAREAAEKVTADAKDKADRADAIAAAKLAAPSIKTYNAAKKRIKDVAETTIPGSEKVSMPPFKDLHAKAQIAFAKIYEEVKAMLAEGGSAVDINNKIKEVLAIHEKALEVDAKAAEAAEEAAAKAEKDKLSKEEVDKLKADLAAAKAALKTAKTAKEKAEKATKKRDEKLASLRKGKKRKAAEEATTKAKTAFENKLKRQVKKLGEIKISTGPAATRLNAKEFDKLKKKVEALDGEAPLLSETGAALKRLLNAAGTTQFVDPALTKELEALIKKLEEKIAKEEKAEIEDLGKQEEIDFNAVEEVEKKRTTKDVVIDELNKEEVKKVKKPGRTPAKAAAYWTSIRPDWAKELGIVFSDLPKTIQELLQNPREGETKLFSEKQILAELDQEAYWAAVQDLVADAEDKGEKFIDYIFSTTKSVRENKLVLRTYKKLQSLSFYGVVRDQILDRFLNDSMRVELSREGVEQTIKARIMYDLDLYEDLIELGFELRTGTKTDSKEIRIEEAKEDERIAHRKETIRLEKLRRKNLGADGRDIEDGDIVVEDLERFKSGTKNLSSTKGTKATKKLEADFAKLGELGKSRTYGDALLKDYFTEKGKLKLNANSAHGTGFKIYKPSSNTTEGEYYWTDMTDPQREKVRKLHLSIIEKLSTEEQLKIQLAEVTDVLKDATLTKEEHRELRALATDLNTKLKKEKAKVTKEKSVTATKKLKKSEVDKGLAKEEKLQKRQNEIKTALLSGKLSEEEASNLLVEMESVKKQLEKIRKPRLEKDEATDEVTIEERRQTAKQDAIDARKAADKAQLLEEQAQKAVEEAEENVDEAKAQLKALPGITRETALAKAKRELTEATMNLIMMESSNVAAKANLETAQKNHKDLGKMDDTSAGMNSRALDEVANPMGVEKIKLLAKTFLKKLYVSPRIHVFRNVTHLKFANRALFDRAEATRLPGEFENTVSMGFAFGSDVILFSDYIQDKRQLQHVITHEVMGHYGLRSLLNPQELKRVLLSIYENDPHIRALTDRAIDFHDMSKLEAIEEVLAEKAAAADISTIVRVWNAIKKALNKLGLVFGDEHARYWVNQLRLYARKGTSSLYNPAEIARNIRNAERGAAHGRFAKINDHSTIASEWHKFNAMNNKMETWFGSATYFKRIISDPTFKRHAKEAGGMAKFVGKSTEIIQTFNHMANRNWGLWRIYKDFQDTGNFSRNYMSELEEMIPTYHARNTTAEQWQHGFEIIAHIAAYRGINVEKAMRKHAKVEILEIGADGNLAINEKILSDLIREASVKLEDVQAGLDIVIAASDEEIGIKKATLPKFGIGKETEWLQKIKEDSPEWQMVIEHQKAIAYAAAQVLLGESHGSLEENKLALEKLKDSHPEFTDVDVEYFKRLHEDYIALGLEGDWATIYPRTPDETREMEKAAREASERAENFLLLGLRPMFESKSLGDLKKALEGKTEGLEFMSDDKYGYMAENVERLNALEGKKEAKQSVAHGIQNVIQNLWLNEGIVQNQKARMLRTILGNYVPFVRDGAYQVIIKAFRIDPSGSLGLPIKINSHTQSLLLYTQTDSLEDAKTMMRDFNKDKEDLEFTLIDENGEDQNVRLVAEYSETRKEAPRGGPVGYTDLIQSLTATGLKLNVEQRQHLILKSERFGSKARSSLPRSITPGFAKKDGFRYVHAHLETQAHVAAKARVRYRISRTMNDNNFWLGDEVKLKTLKRALDRAHTTLHADKDSIHNNTLIEQERIRRHEFERYLFMYRHSKAVSNTHKDEQGNKTEVLHMEAGGKKYKAKLLGKGERYRDHGRRLVAWYEQSTDVVTSTEDLLSGAISAQLKMVTVLGQLGGNIATALVNLTSIPMHTVPYLSSYNPNRGIGGQFSPAKAIAAVTTAGSNLKNSRFGSTKFLENMVDSWPKGKDSNWVNEYGLTIDETEFLLHEAKLGVTAPAQINQLAGSARGGIEKETTLKVIRGWMFPFTYTEQFNRRITALATYRLYHERYKAAHPTWGKQQLRVASSREANKAVDETQGNYDMYNRPQIARGNIFQYPFMYKQFVLTSVQLLWSMGPGARVSYLAMMLLAAGFKGFPFADDLMDLIDTLLQWLHIPIGSVELEAMKILENIAPGSSDLVLNGLMDGVIGGTISTRIAHGDLIPLTGTLRSGASFQRETENLFGPVWAMFKGLSTMSFSTLRWTGEALGIRPDTTSLNDIARESPIAALRAFGDGYAYTRDGVVTNVKGKVVSRDMTMKTIITRILGFYPTVATQENRVVRIGKRVGDYTADIRREFQVAYVKARIEKNQSKANEVLKQVRVWNKHNKGTEFFIRNFQSNANRAVREALRPTSERYLKAASRGDRPNIKWLMDLYDL
jgi:hypothetical protein